MHRPTLSIVAGGTGSADSNNCSLSSAFLRSPPCPPSRSGGPPWSRRARPSSSGRSLCRRPSTEETSRFVKKVRMALRVLSERREFEFELGLCSLTGLDRYLDVCSSDGTSKASQFENVKGYGAWGTEGCIGYGVVRLGLFGFF